MEASAGELMIWRKTSGIMILTSAPARTHIPTRSSPNHHTTRITRHQRLVLITTTRQQHRPSPNDGGRATVWMSRSRSLKMSCTTSTMTSIRPILVIIPDLLENTMDLLEMTTDLLVMTTNLLEMTTDLLEMTTDLLEIMDHPVIMVSIQQQRMTTRIPLFPIHPRRIVQNPSTYQNTRSASKFHTPQNF